MTQRELDKKAVPEAGEAVPAALAACGLTLAWGDGAPVASGIDLEVSPGKLVCLVGKSGMGKTTILHALAGLITPREGRVLLHGEDITGQPGRVSYMLQKDLLLPNLTVIDNACLPLTLAGMPKRVAREQARPLLERFGLDGAQDKWPSQLSGGMRQRAAFLRTYLMGNDVIMLDEPFSALDAITRADMRSWFCEEMHDLGLSTLMITHDADEACMMADCIYVLGHAAPGSALELSSASSNAGPATVIGTIEPKRPQGIGVSDFALTPEFLEAKHRVLECLEG